MKKIMISAVAVLLTMSSCSSYTATGAAFGGAIGSAIGGIAGGYRGSDVGTLVGMAAGAAIGAAAEEQEARRYERAYERKSYSSRQYDSNDDMYYSGSERARYDSAKRERIRTYHENMEAKTSGRKGYVSPRKATSGNGFRLERSTDPMAAARQDSTITIPVTPLQTDSSGYSNEAKYDDRIVLK